MGNNLIVAVPGIDHRFKNDDRLFGNLSSSDPANQLFGFTAEHAAAYNLNPAGIVWGMMRCRVCHIV